jgi:hypothetical protein
MKMTVKIEGLKNVANALNRMRDIISEEKAAPFIVHAKQGEKIAKDILENGDYIDTGALRDSINTSLITETPSYSRIEVVAGSDLFIRGLGKYSTSRKNPSVAPSVQSTREYAGYVENGTGFNRKGPARYMKGAYDWMVMNIDKPIKRLLSIAIGRLI